MKKLVKNILVIILFLSVLNSADAQCPGGWAKQGGNPTDHDGATATVIDYSGNVYVAGQYTDTAVFSFITLISTSYEDIFLAKYDMNGSLLWIKSVGGYNTDSPSSLAVDQS